ncbi:MAG: cytochrome c oxidase assembly protein [Burkholderiales bacterium]|nr:cytochrome c oxidase assembly protein [Burkholderiales bacterium]
MNLPAFASGPAGLALPYCGSAPAPAEVMTRWNLDPLLIALLFAVLAAYLAGVRGRRRSTGSLAAPPSACAQRCFVAGWAIATLALISPLCAWSVALFSARVAQHLLLMLVAAPLLMLGQASVMFDVIRRIGIRLHMGEHWNHRLRNAVDGKSAMPLIAAWLLFTLALWIWHAPGPYQRSFDSTIAYWAMHASLFGSACLLWSMLLAGGSRSKAATIAAALASGAQMGFLGALLTFAPRMLYPVHAASTAAWGLSPLEDQQLGGLLMWVPGGSMMMAAGLLALIIGLRNDDAVHESDAHRSTASRA